MFSSKLMDHHAIKEEEDNVYDDLKKEVEEDQDLIAQNRNSS